MPSRANASLLLDTIDPEMMDLMLCQCPHGLMPHCYYIGAHQKSTTIKSVSMPSRANASLLQYIAPVYMEQWLKVSMPSRANASLLPGVAWLQTKLQERVNALTG